MVGKRWAVLWEKAMEGEMEVHLWQDLIHDFAYGDMILSMYFLFYRFGLKNVYVCSQKENN